MLVPRSRSKSFVIRLSFRIDSYEGKTLWLSNFTELYMDLVSNKFSEVVAGLLLAHCQITLISCGYNEMKLEMKPS